MKKLLLTSLLLLPAAWGFAQEKPKVEKPKVEKAAEEQAEDRAVLVVSFSGYQALVDDLDQVGGQGGQKSGQTLDGVLKFMLGGKGLEGLDKSRPWGLALIAREEGFAGVAFVPVTDTKKLLAVLARYVGMPEDIGDGVLELEIQKTPTYVKEHNGWAFIARTPEELQKLPDDPTVWLNGLDKQYDVAVSAMPQHLPDELVKLGIIQMQQVVEKGLKERLKDETDEQYAQRQKLARAQMEEISKVFQELEQITVGYAIDVATKKVYIDVSLSAVSGSSTAAELTPRQMASQFSGFAIEDAALMLGISDEGTPEQTAQAAGAIEQAVGAILREIEKAGEEGTKWRDLTTSVGDMLKSTVSAGRIDAGMAIVGDGPFTLIGGAAAGDQETIDAFVKNLFQAIEGEEGISAVEMNVAEHAGVAFHRFTATLPPPPKPQPAAGARPPRAAPADPKAQAEAGREAAMKNLRMMFGDEFPVLIGSGNGRIYVAVGPQGLEEIQKAIDVSSEKAETEVQRVRFSMRPGQFVKAAAAADPENLILAITAAQLGEKPNDNDRLQLVVKPLSNGATIRIEAGDGVLPLLGVLLVMGQSGGLQGL